jgi:hypothetical protein
MLRIFSRACLGTLMVFQTLQAAFAWNWYVIDEPCCAEVQWDCCEMVVVESESCGCEAEAVVIDDCGCGADVKEAEASDEPAKPTPAETNKLETSTETEQPSLDTEEELPPAPINVPSEPAAEPSTGDLFPGPVTETTPPAEVTPPPSTPAESTPAEVLPPSTPAAEPATQPNTTTEGLFEEPAAAEPAPAETEPEPTTTQPDPSAEAPPVVTESPETSADDLFGEPSQPADESTNDRPAVEEESAEEESTESESPEEPASDPLDDLFGPSSATDGPELDQEEFAPLHAAGGLASSEFRTWSDRSNDFQCEGRLVRMTTAGVFVAQSNGESVAIAFSQLSDADLGFVRTQLQAQRTLLARQAAERQVASR